MKKIGLFSIIFFHSCVLAFAGDGSFAVGTISQVLKTDANAVKRMEEIRFDLTNLSKPKLYKKFAITILNENGDKYAFFHEWYNKFKEISSISGTLYDEQGKKIRSLKKDEIKDLSGTGEESLIEDFRIKYHNFFYKSYPYTVEYEYEVKFATAAYFPDWIPQESYNYAVQQSSMSVIFPKSYTIRYKTFNYPGDPVKSEDHGNNVYAWQVKDIPVVEKEFASPSWYHLTTMILFGPSQFEVENYKGDMSTWKGWGNFINDLRQHRDELPDDVKKNIHQLTDGVSDKKEKIRLLYEYLQQNTRYISIQLGIGGWQPFDAKYVASKKYGDCKALSNYMYSILKEAGISSYYAVIEAGEGADDMEVDFPSTQGNHVTICVPLEKDSMWLECTSQTVPTGYIGGFTGNRHALIVCENDSRIVSTTNYGMNENESIRRVNGTLDSLGRLNFSSVTRMKAMQQDDMHQRIHSYSKEKMMEFLKSAIDLPTYDVLRFDYVEDKKTIPTVTETLEITAPDYAQISGKRIFILPNIANRISTKLKADDKRKYPIEFTAGYRDIDSVEIKIPQGYKPESVPEDLKLEGKFGRYVRTIKILPEKIIYYRLHERSNSNFPASDWGELVKFYDQMYKADRNRIVLIKQS